MQVDAHMQVGDTSGGNFQIGNATIVSADIGAINGVVHVVDNFPLLNAAFNTSMVTALEAAGDFGPFNEAKVMRLASLCLLYSSCAFGRPLAESLTQQKRGHRGAQAQWVL